MEAGERDIRTFDPLFRDLLTWGLVHDDGHGWALSAPAQARMGQLATELMTWPSERTVFFGHSCADCAQRTVTRLRDGAYVCDPCSTRRERKPEPPPAVPPPRREWALRGRHPARRTA
jgi:hypothetical protein